MVLVGLVYVDCSIAVMIFLSRFSTLVSRSSFVSMVDGSRCSMFLYLDQLMQLVTCSL